MKQFLSVIISVLAAVSCQYKDLCFDHPHVEAVNVSFDWSKSPDASPESMDMIFYPSDGSEALVRTLAGHDGGEIALPVGEYACVCWNGDSESFFIDGENRSDELVLKTSSRSFVPLYRGFSLHSSSTMNPPDPAGQPFIGEPDTIYSGKAGTLIVLAGRDNSVIFTPEQRTIDISIIVRNVSGLGSVSGIKAYLSGLDCGFRPFNETPDASCGVEELFFEMTDASTIAAELRAFGHLSADSGVQPQHILSIVSPLDGEFAYRRSWDVSSIVNDPSQDPAHIVIELDGLDIPEPEVGSGIFTPDVSDWGDDTTVVVGL